MDTFDASFQLSLDSSIDSDDVNFPGCVINRQFRKCVPEPDSNDERVSLIDKVMRLYLKHNTTLECLTDWIELLNTRLEDYEKLPPGKVQLLELFREHCDTVDILLYIKCEKCAKCTKVPSNQKKGSKCSHCETLLKTSETNFFVIIPVKDQIIRSVQKNWKAISVFDTNKNDNSIGDVHDGEILRKVLDIYKDTNINILSLCLNVDGANKFKSNALSLWPIQLMQNFLPPHLRFLPENIIMNGLFYHKSNSDNELNFHQYMRPLVEELSQIKQNPISVCIDDVSKKFKPVITHCAVDLPAKSKIQAIKQFGGYFACTFCEIPGEQVEVECSKRKKKPDQNVANNTKKKAEAVEKKPKKFVRYVEGDIEYKLRSEIETLKKMLAASELDGKQSIDGVKDISCLVGIEHFNIIWSMSVEYMHGCLQGVTKRLLNLFLNPKNSQKDHYISPFKKQTLNKRLLGITPTASIVRKPRSLNDLSNFKASEFRSMLLYYLPICLPGLIPKKYVDHLRLFSAAVYTLLQKNITYDEVKAAEEMLYLFVRQHQNLFGKQSMVMVVHLLKHLAQSVRKLGPLWSHSAFAFERNAGCLLRLANGTTNVMHQISSKYVLAQSNNHRNTTGEYEAKILIGKEMAIQESATHVFDFSSCEILHFRNKSLLVHSRINLKKVIFTSRLYTRPKRSIDFFIGLTNGTLGTAKYYFRHNDQACVMLSEYEIIESSYHIHKVITTNRLIIAPVSEIKKKYLFMKVGLNHYIACRPNPYENE